MPSFVADEDLRGRNVILLTSFNTSEKVCCRSMSLYHISSLMLSPNFHFDFPFEGIGYDDIGRLKPLISILYITIHVIHCLNVSFP